MEQCFKKKILNGFLFNNFVFTGVFPITDRRKLSELNLPKENFLYLVTPNSGDDETTNGEPDKPSDNEEEDFVLEITDETTNKQYSLNFRRKCIKS